MSQQCNCCHQEAHQLVVLNEALALTTTTINCRAGSKQMLNDYCHKTIIEQRAWALDLKVASFVSNRAYTRSTSLNDRRADDRSNRSEVCINDAIVGHIVCQTGRPDDRLVFILPTGTSTGRTKDRMNQICLIHAILQTMLRQTLYV